MKLKKILLVTAGCMGVGLGALGVFHILYFALGVKRVKMGNPGIADMTVQRDVPEYSC